MRTIRTQHNFIFKPEPSQVPRLTYHKGVAVASTGWQGEPKPKPTVGERFARNLAVLMRDGLLSLDALHSSLKLEEGLRNACKQALPYTYGELKNAIERGLA